MKNNFDIKSYGFKNKQNYSTKELKNIARIIKEDKNNYTLVAHNKGFIKARLKGLVYKNDNIETKACVGDFVFYSKAEDTGDYTINSIITRKNLVTRVKGRKIQAIASNVDYAFVIMSLDAQFNITRLERFLLLLQDKNIKTIIVLNKKDLVTNYKPYIKQIRNLYQNIEIHPTSIYDKNSLLPLKKYLSNYNTILMFGVSGVGKSSLVNSFAKEEIQQVQEVSSTLNKGKHTTVTRSIIKTKENFLFIDIPGIKEVTVSLEEDEIKNLDNEVIKQIQSFAKFCKFRNCSHTNEPSCAVLQAVKEGKLKQELLNHYYKIKDIVVNS